ncbi:disease resistance protein [Populus alba x Populus x berolinensis]|nr:disease resistance protein [Populus alba x Populus x berolinensis]
MAIESVGGSIISMLAQLMVEPVGRQFRYMFCFNDFVEEFEQQKEKLVSETERQQDDVKAAERNAKEIYEDVEKWLVDAKNKIEGAKPLENEIGKNGKCFTWCPNCMRQFKLSKALAKKSETFRELLEKKPTKVSHRAHPEPIEFLPSNEFTPSESSKEALEQIMKALKDDTVNMIGLYGMGGVGKTVLVKEVGRRAKELQPPLDEVLMATVSQNPNVIDIQDRMAEQLDLDFKEKSTNAGRADRLWQRLQGKKMLIILDDVWKHIDLKEIGIPFGDDHRGCKILLTTRRRDICSYMVCQKNVFLGLFSEKEAWDLFRINAGLDDGDSTLNRVARDVARECHGLPIALVTMGRALRDESAVKWKRVSIQLKNSKFPDMEQIEEKNAYACLKLSYDYLKSKETKLCFLLCCLFPEDYNIPVEDLTRYAVGYGLHQDGEPIEDAREQVHVAIQDLKACCLLLGTETEEHVRMHDLVRDVAIHIASSKEYGFIVNAGIGLEKWPMSNKSFEGCTTISLMGNKLAELPEGLVCPKLKVLLLELDRGLNVPERFFKGMKEIEVLSLKGGCLSLQSLELSTKLQSLVLMECGCKDLIWLRKLQRLKILGLMWCSSIEELPDEIGELKELRLLDVTGCERLRSIPVNLIGRLKKLEELLTGEYSFQGWDVVGTSTGGMNASLTELNSLSQLAVLSLRIPKVECIPRDFVFPVSLRKYHIKLGNANQYYRIFGNPLVGEERYPTSTRLILDGTSFNAKIFEQLFLHKLESVEVRDCGDVFTLFPARLRQGLKNLKELIVDSCESLEEVFELGEAAAAVIFNEVTAVKVTRAQMHMEGAHRTCQPPKSCLSEIELSQETDIYFHTVPRSESAKAGNP